MVNTQLLVIAFLNFLWQHKSDISQQINSSCEVVAYLQTVGDMLQEVLEAVSPVAEPIVFDVLPDPTLQVLGHHLVLHLVDDDGQHGFHVHPGHLQVTQGGGQITDDDAFRENNSRCCSVTHRQYFGFAILHVLIPC